MIDGTFGILVALGLAISLLATLKGMRATPLVGSDDDGYLSIEGWRQLKELLSRQRTAWRLLVIGFALQFAGALGLSVHALMVAV